MLGMRAITDMEYEKLIRVLSSRDACILTLGIRTGFRISELLSLNISDILQGEKVSECIQLNRARLKGKKQGRSVPLHLEAKQCLETYIKSIDWNSKRLIRFHPEGIPLFLTKNGWRLDRSNYWNNLKNAIRATGESGEQIGTHSMRKRFAKNFYQASGNNIHALQQALGHSSVVTTIKYLASDSEFIASIIKNMK